MLLHGVKPTFYKQAVAIGIRFDLNIRKLQFL